MLTASYAGGNPGLGLIRQSCASGVMESSRTPRASGLGSASGRQAGYQPGQAGCQPGHAGCQTALLSKWGKHGICWGCLQHLSAPGQHPKNQGERRERDPLHLLCRAALGHPGKGTGKGRGFRTQALLVSMSVQLKTVCHF